MSNYVPKEKKPVLNMETVKKDLKYELATPIFLPCFLFFSLAIVVAVTIAEISVLCFDSKSTVDTVYAIIWLVISVPIIAIIGYPLYNIISTFVKIRTNRFYVFPDTIDYKAEQEEVTYYSRKGRRYRYPNVLYFEKGGRFEVSYDTRDLYEERSSRLENAAKRKLDEYELDKTYYVVSLSPKNPGIVMVYDPDDYDVQL